MSCILCYSYFFNLHGRESHHELDFCYRIPFLEITFCLYHCPTLISNVSTIMMISFTNFLRFLFLYSPSFSDPFYFEKSYSCLYYPYTIAAELCKNSGNYNVCLILATETRLTQGYYSTRLLVRLVRVETWKFIYFTCYVMSPRLFNHYMAKVVREVNTRVMGLGL